jgi:hypothetical protein
VLGSGNLPKFGVKPVFDLDPLKIDLFINHTTNICFGKDGALYSTFSDTLYRVSYGKVTNLSKTQKLIINRAVFNKTFELKIDCRGYIYDYNRAKSRIGRIDTLGVDLEWLLDSIVFESGKRIHLAFVDTVGGMFYTQDNGTNLNSALFYLGPDGVHQKLAGNGIMGYSGDGGLAKDAQVCIRSKAILTKDSNLLIH